jgi:hypothetical protein
MTTHQCGTPSSKEFQRYPNPLPCLFVALLQVSGSLEGPTPNAQRLLPGLDFDDSWDFKRPRGRWIFIVRRIFFPVLYFPFFGLNYWVPVDAHGSDFGGPQWRAAPWLPCRRQCAPLGLRGLRGVVTLRLWDMDSMDMGQSLRPILTASTAFCSPNLDPYPDHPQYGEKFHPRKSFVKLWKRAVSCIGRYGSDSRFTILNHFIYPLVI